MGIEGTENLIDGPDTTDTGNPNVIPVPEGDPCPTVPTTSPDVVITEDPGPAPEGDAPVDDGSHTDMTSDDPPSDDAVETVDPLAADA